MNKMRKILILLFLILTFSNLIASITLKVGIWDDYPLCYMENNNPKGIYVELLNYIASKEKWNLEYVYDTWVNLLYKLQNGEIDILTSIAYTEERAKIFDFNNVSVIDNWGVIVSKQHINNIIELSNKTIALMEKDIYAEKFLELTKSFNLNNFTIIWTNSYEEILKYIEDGKADAGIISRLSSIILSKKYSFVESQIVFGLVELRFAFKKGDEINKTIIPALDYHLNELKINPKSVYWKTLNKYLKETVIPGWLKILLFIILPSLAIIILIAFFIIKTLRKIIREKTKEISESHTNLLKTLELASEFIIATDLSEETFLKKVFDLTLKLVPKAKSGSVYFIDQGKIRFIDAKGHSLEKLKALEIDAKYFYIPDKTEIVDMQKIFKNHKETMPEELYKQLKSATKKMKHSILSPLKIDDKVYGILSLDIPAESTESFSDIDVQLVDYFSKIISAFYQVKIYIKLQGIFLKNIVLALVNALEAYDIYTRGHSERVALYATQIAEKMGLDKEIIRKIYWASLVHDIGKLNIPHEILNKPSKLTKEEYEIIKQHPIKGYQILKELEGLSNIAEIVKYHHERWDGKGYPEGLKGEEIPLEVKIIAVADSYDAMTTERPYRKALTKEEAIKELLKNAGTQFDPKVVEVFVQILVRKAEIVVKE
ncbi:MAG: hypothetical protein PWP54_1214 [Thermosipho sp. (in: thermotogales)]|nr:hypothetical protein [Thermosipho sp. (in: thermotogales)]